MFTKIVSAFMSIVIFFAQLLGVNGMWTEFHIYKDISYGENERHTLDLYIPRNAEETGLVLFIHGGAWIGGDKDGYGDALEKYSQETGLACAAINYRYICDDVDLNDIMDDIHLALACIKEKGKKCGTDINKVLLTGGSAGGHLSLLYAYSRKESSPITPVAVVSDCGPTDLGDDNYFGSNGIGDDSVVSQLLSWGCGQKITLETKDEAAEAIKKVSPLYYVDENTVPTVINHGMKDDIVPFTNAQALDAKLTEMGVTHYFNIYPNSGHGLNEDPENMQRNQELLLEYMLTYLK